MGPGRDSPSHNLIGAHADLESDFLETGLSRLHNLSNQTSDYSKYGGKYVVMQYALRLTTEQISTFTGDIYPNDLV